MFEIRHSIDIAAPKERCFLLSTSIEIVAQTIRMHAVDTEIARNPDRMRTKHRGLVTAGDMVRWEGWKFGVPQFHVSLITTFDRYSFFEDQMVAGRFRTFAHAHEFVEVPGGMQLIDTVRFSLPLGPVGWLVGRLILMPHIRGLLRRRFRLLKQIAESEQWREFIPHPNRIREMRATK